MAARKVARLAACGARVTVVATAVEADVRAVPGVEVEERPYREGEAADYRFVVAATDSDDVNEQVCADAEAAGVWVNDAGEPRRGTCTLPAITRRGPLLVAVSTGGASPAVAAWLAERLGGELGPEHEVLVELAAAERGSSQPAGEGARSPDWRKALDSDMLELIRAGQVDQARELLRTCLSSSSD